MKTKVKVTEQGVIEPREFFSGIDEVEIHKDRNLVIVQPVSDDPILLLGTNPVKNEIEDAAENHDQYIYKS